MNVNIVKTTSNRSTRIASAARCVGRLLAGALELIPAFRWRIERRAADVDEVPPRIPKRRAYIVATAILRKWLVFDCPCGTGHRIMLNLDRSRFPYWRLTLSATRQITLSPSIDYHDEYRRCHYFLRKGRVIWAKRPRNSRLSKPME